MLNPVYPQRPFGRIVVRSMLLLCADLTVVIPAAAESSPDCAPVSETLPVESLEQYGIRLRLVQGTGGYRVDLSVQPAVCIRSGKSDCGSTTYEFSAAGLNDRGALKPVKTARPNDYEYTASFHVDEKALRHSTLNLTYRGGRCGDRFGRHIFVIELDGLKGYDSPYYF